MRALISFLLCLAVAFQGMAYAQTFAQPCAMEQEMQEMVMDHSAATSDCCNDADMAAKTGQACKTGQSCTPLGTFTDALMGTKTPRPVALIPRLSGVMFMPSADQSSIWRPPLLS